LKIHLRYELPSPELELIADSFVHEAWEVTRISPWDIKSHTEVADVAFCLGPVSSCPLARHRVLLVLGQTRHHPDMNWDLVLVTSSKARRLALAKFGHGVKVVQIDLPLAEMEFGSKMIVESVDYVALRASELKFGGGEDFALWANIDDDPLSRGTELHRRLFCLRTFNALVRSGAVGLYEDMEDGYDIQVRRHLALGGKVVCPRDKEVIGDLVDCCFVQLTGVDNQPFPGKQDCAGNVNGFSLSKFLEIL